MPGSVAKLEEERMRIEVWPAAKESQCQGCGDQAEGGYGLKIGSLETVLCFRCVCQTSMELDDLIRNRPKLAKEAQ